MNKYSVRVFGAEGAVDDTETIEAVNELQAAQLAGMEQMALLILDNPHNLFRLDFITDNTRAELDITVTLIEN